MKQDKKMDDKGGFENDDQFMRNLAFMMDKIGYSGKKMGYEYLAKDLFDTVWEDQYTGPFLNHILDQGMDFSEELEEKITFTCKEFMLNSRVYRKQDDDKVRFDAYIGDKGIIVMVQDQGNGYDVNANIRKFLSETAPDDIIKPWTEDDTNLSAGTYCLVRFADAFTHNRKGNAVAAMFYIPEREDMKYEEGQE